MEALHALEAEHDVFRTIGRVDDLDDVFTRLLVDHGTGEQAIFPFGRRCGEGLPVPLPERRFRRGDPSR